MKLNLPLENKDTITESLHLAIGYINSSCCDEVIAPECATPYDIVAQMVHSKDCRKCQVLSEITQLLTKMMIDQH